MVKLKEIEEFFLEASRQTYAADAPKTTIAELPKSKVLRYERGDWLYVDLYFSANGKSFGQTIVWHQDQPVWGMQYRGDWDKSDERVIPFLKSALKTAYDQGEFRGGRGPEYFENADGSLKYINHLPNSIFTNFSGDEKIYASGKGFVLYHAFNSITLI